MAFRYLGLRGAPLAKVVSALAAEFSSCPDGTKLPPQTAAPKVFGCGSTQYMKALKQLHADGVITKVGQGIGYVTGTPSEERIKELKDIQRARGKKLINNTRSAKCTQQGVATRDLRKQVRDKMLEALINEGIEHHVVSALRDHDVNHMVCVEKALKLVGCSFEQSPEAQEMLNKAAQPALAQINFAFSIAEKPKAIEAEVVEVPD